jgi:hypothetical protein
MLVVKSWFDEAECEYVGMERKGSLYNPRKPQKSMFPNSSIVLHSSKRKLRYIPRIKILTLWSAAHKDKCVDVSPRIHSVFCNKSSRHQGFDKMQINHGALSLSHVVPTKCFPVLVCYCLLGSRVVVATLYETQGYSWWTT